MLLEISFFAQLISLHKFFFVFLPPFYKMVSKLGAKIQYNT